MLVSKLPSYGFLMRNCENPNQGNGHGKLLIWSWKVMEFRFLDFCGSSCCGQNDEAIFLETNIHQNLMRLKHPLSAD